MIKLSDQALAVAKLFVLGPAFELTYRTRSRIPAPTKAALDELVNAKVISENEIDGGKGLVYRGLARARTVGRIMSDTRAAKIKLPMTDDGSPVRDR